MQPYFVIVEQISLIENKITSQGRCIPTRFPASHDERSIGLVGLPWLLRWFFAAMISLPRGLVRLTNHDHLSFDTDEAETKALD